MARPSDVYATSVRAQIRQLSAIHAKVYSRVCATIKPYCRGVPTKQLKIPHEQEDKINGLHGQEKLLTISFVSVWKVKQVGPSGPAEQIPDNPSVAHPL